MLHASLMPHFTRLSFRESSTNCLCIQHSCGKIVLEALHLVFLEKDKGDSISIALDRVASDFEVHIRGKNMIVDSVP